MQKRDGVNEGRRMYTQVRKERNEMGEDKRKEGDEAVKHKHKEGRKNFFEWQQLHSNSRIKFDMALDVGHKTKRWKSKFTQNPCLRSFPQLFSSL